MCSAVILRNALLRSYSQVIQMMYMYCDEWIAPQVSVSWACIRRGNNLLCTRIPLWPRDQTAAIKCSSGCLRTHKFVSIETYTSPGALRLTIWNKTTSVFRWRFWTYQHFVPEVFCRPPNVWMSLTLSTGWQVTVGVNNKNLLKA